jgi:hypothetical protein
MNPLSQWLVLCLMLVLVISNIANQAANSTLTAIAAAVTAVAITGGMVCQIILQVMARVEAKKVSDKQAKEVKEVKNALAESDSVVGLKLDTIHKLVNKDMHVALATIARLERREADRTGKNEDIAKAVNAEAMLARHDANQVEADKGKP